MATLTIGKEDLLRSKTVNPGWYRAEVKRVGEKPSKGDGSTVFPVDLIIVTPGDFEGVPVTTFFSEKAPGFAVKFIEAAGGVIGKDGGTFNLDASVGKTMDVFIENDMYQGRLTNSVKDYRKAS